MFDRIAPRYDFLNHFLSLGIDRLWRRRTVTEVVRRLPRTEDSERTSAPSILDVATGTGDLAIALARRSGRKVAGIDFSPEMLRIGRDKVGRSGLADRITFLEGDGLNLPFEANSFDATTIAFGIRNMADTGRGLAEMIRVTRPGGVVAVLEFSIPTLPVLSSFYRFYFFKVLPKIGRFFSRKSRSAYQYLPASVARFDSIPVMRGRFEEAGLTEIVVHPMTFGIAVLYLGRKPEGGLGEGEK